MRRFGSRHFADAPPPGRWLACGLAAALGLGTVLPVRADIYTYTDEAGVVHLSNHPTDQREVVLVRQPQPQNAQAATANTPPASGKLAGMPYARLVDAAARSQHVDRALVHAVIATESRYNPVAVSPKGARGLMQLMPATARRYGVVDILDPAQNIAAGTRYLKDLLDRFNQDLPLSLAAYNAGTDAVVSHGNKVPPYRETQHYVTEVLNRYHHLAANR